MVFCTVFPLACMVFAVLDSKTSELAKLRRKESSSTNVIGEAQWDAEEYKYLLTECQWALAAVKELDTLNLVGTGTSCQRLQLKFKDFKMRVEAVIRGLVRKQRQPASHAMVFIPQDRSRKPYALPVQLLPYRGLKDSTVRDLANKLKMEMKSRDMEDFENFISRQ